MSAIKVDFEGFLCEETLKQTTFVYELLNIRVETGNEYTKAFDDLIIYPVIPLFIFFKWRKPCGYFYAKSFVFISFLLSYSLYIVFLFTRPEVYCSELEELFSYRNICFKGLGNYSRLC